MGRLEKIRSRRLDAAETSCKGVDAMVMLVYEDVPWLLAKFDEAVSWIDRLSCEMDDCPCTDPWICKGARDFLRSLEQEGASDG